jgi:hypothetical protein
MIIKHTNIFHTKALQKISKLRLFGMKINYLATLLQIRSLAKSFIFRRLFPVLSGIQDV